MAKCKICGTTKNMQSPSYCKRCSNNKELKGRKKPYRYTKHYPFW